MDRPEDYRALGVADGPVEIWEDGLREQIEPNGAHWEWWYFDAELDDGSSVVIQFLNPAIIFPDKPAAINFRIVDPDGGEHNGAIKASRDQVRIATQCCDVNFGPHFFRGDLQEYDIHVDSVDGLGADIHFTNLGKPYRPGSAYFGFGDNDEDYYTWLCIAPKCEVEGRLTYGGKTVEVHGFGYHDHQWGSKPYIAFFNDWTWARQKIGDYSVTMFNMVANARYGFERYPIVVVEDASGDIIFSSHEGIEYSYDGLMHDGPSDKDYPTTQHHVFQSGSKTFEYTITPEKVLQSRLHFPNPTPDQEKAFAAQGIKPSYARYQGTAAMRLIDDGDVLLDEEGPLIYEVMFPGIEFK